MSFFENNKERVRSDLFKLLHDDDNDNVIVPCSKNNCDLNNDTDDDDVDEIITLTNDVFNSIKKKSLGGNHDNEDGVNNGNHDNEDDTNSEEEEEDMCVKIENDINILEKDLKIVKNKYSDISLFEDDEEENDNFINNLIEKDIEDGTSATTYIDEKPYKIEIHSTFEPDGEYEEVSETLHCNSDYVDFDAFYENYISDKSDEKQFDIFNDIIVENLIHTDDSIQTIVSDFRKKVSQEWIEFMIEANVEYNLALSDPKKWVNRSDTILFDMYQKQPIIDYVYHLGKLLVLFDIKQTFSLNEHMYVDISNKALEPIDFKKYKLEDLMEYYTKGKHISRILVQDIVDNIKIKQNVKTINLLIEVYNKITDSSIKELNTCQDSQDLINRVKEQLLTQHQQPHLVLNRPIIYVDPDTKKIYIFDYRKLNDRFINGDKINPYTNKEFTPEFIELCNQKMKNNMLCVFCKDKISDDNSMLKTIYLHPKYGPIILKFCDTTCMSDQAWTNKALQNAIIGIV